MQKVVRQSRRPQSNRFRPPNRSTVITAKNSKSNGVQKQGFQHAKGCFRKDRPTGLRSLNLFSNDVKSWCSQTPIQEEQEVQEAVSPWFTREPASFFGRNLVVLWKQWAQKKYVLPIKSSLIKMENAPKRVLVPAILVQQSHRYHALCVERVMGWSSSPTCRAKYRSAHHKLWLKLHRVFTPQRSTIQRDQSSRSVLPIASIFSEQSRIGQSIARHQALIEKKSSIGLQTADKTQRRTPTQKRQNVRRAQLFSTPDRFAKHIFCSTCGRFEKQSSMVHKSTQQSRDPRSHTRILKEAAQQCFQGCSTSERFRSGSNTTASRFFCRKPLFARRASRVQDVDIWVWWAAVPSKEQRVSSSTYAMDRMDRGDDSSYQAIDQRVQKDRSSWSSEWRPCCSYGGSVSHQVRERRLYRHLILLIFKKRS